MLIFNSIVENVIIVKDEDGNVYWPEYGLNSIGNLTIGEGYQTKMSNFSNLSISGLAVDYNETITLDEGWSIIGYFHQECGPLEVFEPYSEGIVIIKDENGNVYWPEYELNSIESMCPGEGYQIKTLIDFSFSYENLPDGRLNSLNSSVNTYFSQPKITGNNMTILFPFESKNNVLFEHGEIAAYDQNGLLVGSVTIANNHTVLTVWGDDSTTLEKDGIYEGEEVLFKYWNAETNQCSNMELVLSEGYRYYNIDGINVVSQINLNTNFSNNKRLIQVVDVLGRPLSECSRGVLLIYVYSDGSIERKYCNK